MLLPIPLQGTSFAFVALRPVLLAALPGGCKSKAATQKVATTTTLLLVRSGRIRFPAWGLVEVCGKDSPECIWPTDRLHQPAARSHLISGAFGSCAAYLPLIMQHHTEPAESPFCGRQTPPVITTRGSVPARFGSWQTPPIPGNKGLFFLPAVQAPRRLDLQKPSCFTLVLLYKIPLNRGKWVF